MLITVDNVQCQCSGHYKSIMRTSQLEKKLPASLALFGDFRCRCTTREKKMASKKGRTQKNLHYKVDQLNFNNREEDGLQQVRDWSELPTDLLDLVFMKLHYIDQINSRAVCKAWNINRVLSVKQKMPWLLTFNIRKDYDDADYEYSCQVTDPNYGRTYNMSMDIINEKRLSNIHVHESKNGWLLISSQPTPELPNGALSSDYPSGTSFFLFSPFLTHNNFIELPIHTSLFSLATFSSVPSREDFILLTMNSYTETININTYCLGDRSWKIYYFECDFPLLDVKSLVYSYGEFICPSLFGNIGVFNVVKKDWTVLPLPEMPLLVLDPIANVNVATEDLEVYLVRSDDFHQNEDNEVEIFLVYLRNNPTSPAGCLLMCVFKLLDPSQLMWEKVEAIDSRIMFLGSGCTSFVRRERSDGTDDRIYYIWDNNKMKHCKVSMATRSYPCSKLYGSLSRQLSSKVWIEPPVFSYFFDKQKRWVQ